MYIMIRVAVLLSLLTASSAFHVSPHYSRVTTSSSPFVQPIPHSRSTTPLYALVDKEKETRINNNKSSIDFDIQGLIDKIQNVELDWDRLSDSVSGVKENVMQGEVGQRGELWFIAQLVCLLGILGGGVPFIGNALFFLLGPGLLLIGAAAILLSVMDMGSALSPWPKPPSGQGLITDGLFAQCRHPMYAGLLAACAGLAVVTDSVPRLVLTAVLYAIFQSKSNLEEYELSQMYGQEYSSYKAQVPDKFVPKAIMDVLDKTKSS
ncbi:hypothetical protein MPSEU_000906500 [Mayamaea pseudoterrestris]|nr:hypothetical protein MPSEU_000906500 [Mayamaea pseudoterrestris]